MCGCQSFLGIGRERVNGVPYPFHLWEESSAHTEQTFLVPFALYPLIVSALEIRKVDLASNHDTPYLEDHNELGTSLYALHTMRSS